jgi:hypothetical protein
LSEARKRRFPWILLPTALLGLLAALWSAAWFVFAGLIDGGIDDWIEREASIGRNIDCAGRALRGFPFRFEVTCRGLDVRLRGPEGETRVELGGFVAVAQAWDPTHVIIEATAPLRVSEPNFAVTTISFADARASVRGTLDNPGRFSLVAGKVAVDLAFPRRSIPGVGTLTLPGANPAPIETERLWQGERFEAHARRDPAASVVPAPFELAVGVTKAIIPRLKQTETKPLDIALQGRLTGLVDLLPRPLPEHLRLWQSRGGVFDLTRGRASTGDILVDLGGSARLTAQGRWDGQLRVGVVGLDKVPALLGETDPRRSPLGLLQAFGERVQIDGKPGVAFPIRIEEGQALFGPFPIAALPQAF